ncbi:MAG: hypothetical protein L0Y72_15305 [Gemmataceae bacterium]|nr:hypothetical protein [Gemmataceae bacterium]MCI0740412.1 hypothetical protein [Gemmataceae bacterium]
MTFRGESFRAQGVVPVSMLAAKLQALQNVLYHAAAAVVSDKAPRRGPWQNRYRGSAELLFEAAHHSELSVEMELPHDTYLAEDFEIGQEALSLVFELGHVLQAEMPSLDELDLGRDERNYLLRAFEGLLPSTLDDYEIELENCSPARHPKVKLSPAMRRVVRSLLQREPLLAAEPVTLVGELVKIHVGVGPELIAIRQRGVEIPCYYPDGLRDQIANLMAGSLVEVTGWATLDNEGRVKSVEDILEVETVSTDPIRLSRFEHGGVRYNLRKPLVVNIEYTDGLWVYHNESFNLWGYGDRREDALADLHGNFAYVWKEFAEENDDVLDSKAKAIKGLLLETALKT